MHLSRENNAIDTTLLSRIVRSAILSPAFTERQKAMVLCVAQSHCPEDLISWMTPPGPVEGEAAADIIEIGLQEDLGSANPSRNDTDVDAQEMTTRKSPDAEEVETPTESLDILGEIDMNPPAMVLPKPQQSFKGGDAGTSPNDTTSPTIEAALAIGQSLENSGPPTPSPSMTDDGDNGNKDTSNLND